MNFERELVLPERKLQQEIIKIPVLFSNPNIRLIIDHYDNNEINYSSGLELSINLVSSSLSCNVHPNVSEYLTQIDACIAVNLDEVQITRLSKINLLVITLKNNRLKYQFRNPLDWSIDFGIKV